MNKNLCGKCQQYFDTIELLSLHVHNLHPKMNNTASLFNRGTKVTKGISKEKS